MSDRAKKLLVVDDMKINYTYLSRILHSHGFETLLEMDPLQVVNVASLEKPDAILLDFEMPVLSGPEVCRQLRASPITSHIPIIFVTSHTGEVEIEEAFSAGADDYVLKPPREKEILSRLRRVFLNQDLQSKVQTQFEEQALLTRVLSHDINNLLTLVQMGLQGVERTVKEGKNFNDPQFQKEFNRASIGTQRIGSLVAMIRELQSLEDHKLELKLRPISLKELFEELEDVFAERLLAKDLRLEMDADPEIKILAEPGSLSNSVFNNLVSNAIKFSFPGGRITLKAEAMGDRVQVEVRDQGIGMDEELLAKVFNKTEKTSRPGTANEKGTGFGMPIVKRYMELYGGTIQIQSTSREKSQNSGTLVRMVFRSQE